MSLGRVTCITDRWGICVATCWGNLLVSLGQLGFDTKDTISIIKWNSAMYHQIMPQRMWRYLAYIDSSDIIVTWCPVVRLSLTTRSKEHTRSSFLYDEQVSPWGLHLNSYWGILKSPCSSLTYHWRPYHHGVSEPYGPRIRVFYPKPCEEPSLSYEISQSMAWRGIRNKVLCCPQNLKTTIAYLFHNSKGALSCLSI